MTASPVSGAAAVVELIRSGELTAVEHVQQVLAAIDASQDDFAAWAYVDRAGALAAAAHADRVRTSGGWLGPLHGVAIGVKDVIPVAGMPMRAGSRATRDSPDEKDATAVERLREAGAVLVGKTTTHEFASGQGDPGTRSPVHPDRHPGGSSVGSAVAVALRTVGATLATDTTGSIRNPAAANAVVGFKPSGGAVATDGLLYFSDTLDTIGPIAPTVADCRLVMSALLGADLTSDEPASRTRLAVAPGTNAHPGFRDVLDRVLSTLADAGIDVVECRPPDYDQSMTAALVISLVEVARHHADRLTARAGDYLPPTRRLIAGGVLLDDRDEDVARRAGRLLRRQLGDLAVASGADALVALTLPGPQPLLSDAVTSLTASAEEGSLSAGIHHLSLANLTGSPAVTLPVGTAEGFPVGLHLLGLRGSDADLLRVAADVEARLAHAPASAS